MKNIQNMSFAIYIELLSLALAQLSHLYRTCWWSWSCWGLHTTLHILVELGTSVLGWAKRFVTSSLVSNGSTLSMFSTLMLEGSYPIFFRSCPSAYSYCLNQSQFPIMSIQYFSIERFLFYHLCLIKSECHAPNILINLNFSFFLLQRKCYMLMSRVFWSQWIYIAC